MRLHYPASLGIKQRVLMPVVNILCFPDHFSSSRISKSYFHGCEESKMATNLLSEGRHTFNAKHVNLSYIISDREPLIVVPSIGWGATSAYLQAGLKPLEAQLTLLYFEPRGNGDSSRPSSQNLMTTALMASDLEELRLHLDIPTMGLLGHSDGGSISLAYASRYPKQVEDVVLVSHRLQDFNATDRAVFREKRKDHLVYGPALAALQASEQPSTDEEFSLRIAAAMPYYFAEPTKIEESGLKQLMGEGISVWALQGYWLGQKEHPFPHVGEMGKITAKTLCLFGKEDGIYFVQEGQKTVEGIQGANLIAYEECAHFLGSRSQMSFSMMWLIFCCEIIECYCPQIIKYLSSVNICLRISVSRAAAYISQTLPPAPPQSIFDTAHYLYTLPSRPLQNTSSTPFAACTPLS